MKYAVIVERVSLKSWNAYVPDLPGCVAAAASAVEARRLISEAIPRHIAFLRKRGERVPRASTQVFDVAE